jgi:hypothetical protein
MDAPKSTVSRASCDHLWRKEPVQFLRYRKLVKSGIVLFLYSSHPLLVLLVKILQSTPERTKLLETMGLLTL